MSEGLWSEMGRLYRGPRAWLSYLSTIYIFLFFAVAIWMTVCLFAAETTRDQILYASGGVVAFVIAAACKMYLYMQMDRNAVIDRIKRLEQRLEQS